MRFTRWTNPSLPQTLQIAVFLLYFNAASSVLYLLGSGFGGSTYVYVAWFLPNSARSLRHIPVLISLVVLAAGAAYLFAGLMIANGQKLGWKLGVGVSTVAVVLPVAAVGLSVVTTSLVITFMFDVALVALLLHTRSREHQRIWFS